MDDLKTSRSILGNQYPDFEMLDAKIASCLKKILQNSHFKKKRSQSRIAKGSIRWPIPSRKTERSYDLMNIFCVTGTHVAVLDQFDLFSLSLHGDDVQGFDTRWDEVDSSGALG